MSTATGPTQGFIAVSGTGPDLPAALAAVDADGASVRENGSLATATWGIDAQGLGPSEPLLLSGIARRREQELGPQDVRRLLAGFDDDGLAQVLPTFAAVDRVGPDGLVAAADALGFRHLFHGTGDGFAVLSTSARAVAACLGGSLNREALAVQSLLGWQLGQRTVFEDVHKLEPGTLATLADGEISVRSFRPGRSAVEPDLDAAVDRAASVLRDYMDAFLDDHPDAVLQLTGGQDSRLLLSAIPRERRRGLRTVTLGVPGNPDAVVAGELSARYGMVHELLTLDGIEALDPADADRRCIEAAQRLECMADPVAYAALAFAESRSQPGPRISGLGGEVARGFYYLGRVRTEPVTRERVERLARWRMFANEAVSADALDPAFTEWAREFAVGEVHSIMAATGRDWMSATDDLYLDQRMQRWAGITETSVCLNRIITNPMLDDRFIEIARTLTPSHKRNSMFLSRLQVALDGELARIPLDGRPAPIAYARPGVANSARQMATTMGKVARKARQKAVRANRPPAGGEILARKVSEHWRADPSALDLVRDTGIFRSEWIDQMLAGGVDPAPSAVALITNLRVAAMSCRGRDLAGV